MKKNREELHRTFAGVLYEADFSTDRPSPWNLNRISQSLYYAAREREAGTSGTKITIKRIDKKGCDWNDDR